MNGRWKQRAATALVAGTLAMGLAAAGAAQAPGGDAPAMYKGTPGRTGEVAGPAPAGPVGTLWSVQTEGLIKSNPAVLGDRVVIVGGDGHLLALDPATGAQHWRSADAGYVGSPAATPDHVVAATGDGALAALDLADGALRWTTPGTFGALTAPLVTGDVVVAGSEDGRVVALDLATGQERWSHQLSGAVTTRGPATDGTRVFVGSADGLLSALDLATGDLAWSWAYPTTCCATVAARDGLVVAAGVGADEAGLLVAFDATNGRPRWQFTPADGSGMRSPSMDADAVYVKADTGTMVALSAADGSLRWTAAVEPGESPIVVAGETLLVIGPADAVSAVDTATGAIRWSAPLGGEVTGGIGVADGRILAGTSEGTVVALGTGGALAAASPTVDNGIAQASIVRTIEPPGGFDKVMDIAFDAAGDAWMPELAGGTFAIFSPEGTFIERFGTKGSENGQFDFGEPGIPDGMTSIVFLPDGGFWVADSGNHRLQRFGADRDFIASVGHFGDGDGRFRGFLAMARDANGLLYVLDYARKDIQVFTADGAYLRRIPLPDVGQEAHGVTGIEVVGDRIFVPLGWPKGDRVVVLGTDGSTVGTIADARFRDVTDATAGPDGRIFLADWGKLIHALDPATLAVVGSWEVLHAKIAREPNGVGVAPDGRVWSAQWTDDVVDILELPGLPPAAP